MTLYIYDMNEYTGYLHFVSADYETEFSADVDDCYDYDTEEWDDAKVRAAAEAQVKEHFGGTAEIVWETI